MAQVLGDAKEHFWLMIGMARARDVDLGAALAEGRISSADYAGMHTACRTCENPGACRALLDRFVPADPPPSYCRNTRTLDTLKAGQTV